MTVLVGILCQDGVVLASDSAATFGTAGGQRTIGQQEMRKLRRVNEHILYTGTGAVGISQIIGQRLKWMWDNGKLTNAKAPEEMMDRIGNEIA